MGNNEFVSVPCELAGQAAECLEHLCEAPSVERSIAEELRALLAQPAAKDKGEPVAWQSTECGSILRINEAHGSYTIPLYTHAAAGEVERLQGLCVTNIILDVVPGEGDGLEVYAKSVADVEQALSAAWLRTEDAEGERDTLRAQLAEALEFVDAFKSNLGFSRASCDKYGRVVWDRIQSLQDRVSGASTCRTPIGCECPGDGVSQCKRCPSASAEPSAPKCCDPTAEEEALLASGDYRPEELWGGSRPTCPKCIKSAQGAPVERDERASNTGHGHVFPRHDGVKARCGGPGICKQCSVDQAIAALERKS